MTPCGLHEPLKGKKEAEASVRAELCPPLKSSLCNPLPAEIKPSERPSGDQNELIASSVPGSFWAVSESIERSQRAEPSFISASAMRVPSGDTDMSKADAGNGGANENRTIAASGVLR